MNGLAGRLSPLFLFVFVAGIVYVVLGVAGLFAGGPHAWVFGGSELVAILRTVTGVIGLATSRREPTARGYAWGAGRARRLPATARGKRFAGPHRG